MFSQLLTVFSTLSLLVPSVYSHAHIHCHHAESCSNKRLLWTNASDEYVGIHCHGMAACFNSTIRSPYGFWTPNCDAAAACIDLRQHINETLQSFTCGGYYGCHNAWSQYRFVNTISCSAERGCYKSYMHSNYIQCSGLLGCEDTNILTGSLQTSSATIFSYGTLSLYNSIINTEGNGQIVHFKLYGHLSGYGATINCNGMDKCELYCYSPLACLNVEFVCGNNAKCFVSYYAFGSDETMSMNISSGDVYEGVTGFDDYMDMIINDWMWLMDQIEDVTDIGENYTAYYNELCGDYNICKNKYGCKGENITVDDDTNRGYYCITGYNAGNDGSLWMGEGVELVVDGANCLESGTHQGSNIRCRGANTCKGDMTTYGGTGNIYCNGDDACKDSEGNGWSGIKNLYCLGKESCQNIDTLTGAENIYGFGYFALDNMVINTNGDESNPQTLNIYLASHKAGDDMVINCLGQDTCKITCLDITLDCIEKLDYTFNCGDEATCTTATLASEDEYVPPMDMSTTDTMASQPPINTNGSGHTKSFGILITLFIGVICGIIA